MVEHFHFSGICPERSVTPESTSEAEGSSFSLSPSSSRVWSISMAVVIVIVFDIYERERRSKLRTGIKVLPDETGSWFRVGFRCQCHLPKDRETNSCQLTTSDKKNLDVGASLFIRNLDPGVGEKMLYDTFSAFGVIVQTPKIV
ncbi:unnamed protein product [Rhizophagus irregularis]|nr:unnamed protein product [Rhizophagus irregularis]